MEALRALRRIGCLRSEKETLEGGGMKKVILLTIFLRQGERSFPSLATFTLPSFVPALS